MHGHAEEREAAREPGLTADAAGLANVLARLRREDAVSLPALDETLRRDLVSAAENLPFRPARPVVGEGANAVYQDFDLCMKIPGDSLFRGVAERIERVLDAALARMAPVPLPPPFRLNELIVQRYAAGSDGISPHRDHVRYRGLVAIVPLSGAGRFFVCADRAGGAAREVPADPGCLLLMRAPGFAGRPERPFHFVRDITHTRLSFGLRFDSRAG